MLIDCSQNLTGYIAELKAAKVTGAGRYIGWDSVPGYPSIGKNISVAEAKALIAAGIDIFLAFEYGANEAASGSAQGNKDGQLATEQLRQFGAPADMAVYFAVDFDIPDYAPSLPDTPANAFAKLGPVGKYFQAIKVASPEYAIGGYGGYYAITRLFDAGLIRYGWQTVAWSGGKLDSRAGIYQLASPTGLNLSSDLDIREHASTSQDYGQWPRPAVPVVQEEEVTIVLTGTSLPTGSAVVLPVPKGSSKILLYADPGFGSVHVAPEIRVGTSPHWNGGPTVRPAWESAAELPLEAGVTEVTIGRIDSGSVGVTVAFA
jgi:hypothetical protein